MNLFKLFRSFFNGEKEPLGKDLEEEKGLEESDDSGLYVHYTGKLVDVIGIVRDPFSDKEYVIYKTGAYSWWMRSRSDFFGTVKVDGVEVRRFRSL
jgi:hypothetical protein